MKEIYEITDYCFMGYTITKNNFLTFHHVKIKKCDKGPRIIENGAILTKDAHEYLNLIERTEYDIYILINRILIEINESKKHPTLKHLKRIHYLLKEFENLHKNDKNYYEENIIKEHYYKRILN